MRQSRPLLTALLLAVLLAAAATHGGGCQPENTNVIGPEIVVVSTTNETNDAPQETVPPQNPGLRQQNQASRSVTSSHAADIGSVRSRDVTVNSDPPSYEEEEEEDQLSQDEEKKWQGEEKMSKDVGHGHPASNVVPETDPKSLDEAQEEKQKSKGEEKKSHHEEENKESGGDIDSAHGNSSSGFGGGAGGPPSSHANDEEEKLQGQEAVNNDPSSYEVGEEEALQSSVVPETDQKSLDDSAKVEQRQSSGEVGGEVFGRGTPPQAAISMVHVETEENRTEDHDKGTSNVNISSQRSPHLRPQNPRSKYLTPNVWLGLLDNDLKAEGAILDGTGVGEKGSISDATAADDVD